MKRAALFALLLTNVATCYALTLTKNDELARDAAVQWLQLIDAGRFDEAASQGATEVRSFDQWRDYFTTHRTPVGRLNRRELIEIKHRPTFPGAFQVRKYYVLRFKSSFEHSPSPNASPARTYGAAGKTGASEEIVLAKIGCCWEIFEYKISDQ